MNIVVEYDSSAASAPAGFKTAVQAAVSYLDNLFSNNVSVPIVFGYGEIQGQALSAGAIGESSANGGFLDYSQLKSALTTSATSADDQASLASLPSSDPTNGGQFFVTDAQAAGLGINGNPSFQSSVDGDVGLSSSYALDFNPGSRAAPGQFDAVGVLEHEITEVLGRQSALGTWSYNGTKVFTALDLFRYSSPGVRDLTPASGDFSVDGKTMLTPFNNPQNGGDGGDWASSVTGDSFGDASPDTVDAVTQTDQRVMDVIGWTLASATTPAPTPTPTPTPTPAPSSVYTGAAAAIAASFDTLNGETTLTSIVISDNAAVVLTATQATHDTAAIGKLSDANGSSPVVMVSDTGANISSHLSGLASTAHLGAVTVTDGAAVTVAASQYAADQGVLAKIAGAHTVMETGFTGAYASEAYAYDAKGALAAETLYNTNGSLSITGKEGGVTFTSTGHPETITVSNTGDTFVFSAGMGAETINGYRPGSDALDFSTQLVASAATLLADARNDGHGGTLITLAAGETVDLAGVSLTALRQHPGDLHFISPSAAAGLAAGGASPVTPHPSGSHFSADESADLAGASHWSSSWRASDFHFS